MTRASKFFLVSIGTFLIILILSGVYLAVGASVFGPKTEVSEACASITSGMSLPEATAIAEQQGDMDTFTYDDDGDVLQVSKVSSGWICVCKANLENDGSDNFQVASVDEVFCVD